MNIAEISKLSLPADITVSVPGSKSYCQRALLIAALCEEDIQIKNLLDSKDTKAMQDSIAALKENRSELMINESGLTARFITALACISPGSQTISGTPNLQKRPIKDLVDALRQLGADIEYKEKEGFLPIVVSSEQLSGDKVSLSGQTSSQYLSALLLIAPVLGNGLEITVEGKQISKPYLDITIDIMSSFGVNVENDNYQRYTVKPQKYKAKVYEVEADYSSAAYFYAINTLTGSNIKVGNLNPNSKQGDKKFVDLIKTSEWHGGRGPSTNIVEVDGRDSRSDEARVENVEDFPDQAMTLGVLAAFKGGKTVINGVKSLRIKETERVKALENELAKMGIKTESTDDTLTIFGGSPKLANIDTYGDHRIAMSCAGAAVKLGGMKIFRPEVVEKTFPGFWNELGKITEVKISKLKPESLLLIGMRGSGKSTIGKILANKLAMDFVDMDELIEQKQGQKVKEIVEGNGWDHFRQLESELCAELAELKNTVIASGGGIVLNDENMSKFRNNTLKLLFVAETGLLSERIKGDANRYELTGQPTLLGELSEVWEDRREKYYKNADFVFDTSEGTPDQLVQDIIDRLGL